MNGSKKERVWNGGVGWVKERKRKGEGDDLTMSKMMIRVYLVESDTERITLIT